MSASVVVEVLVTIAVQYAFAALGLVLVSAHAQDAGMLKTIGLALLLSLPLPALAALLLRRGGIFQALERWARRLLGNRHPLPKGIDGERLDAAIEALLRRSGTLFCAFAWQFAGYALGALENYWALSMLGQPVSLAAALAIEALTQAVRQAAFLVPGGLGVQEIAVVALAQLFGVGHDIAVSLALVKRMREVVFGCAALGSWQIAEMLRARHTRAANSPNYP